MAVDADTSLQTDWALILGSSSGFGAAVAQALARRGLGIIGVHLDRRTTLPRAQAVIEAVAAQGVPVRFFNRNAAEEATRGEVCDWLAQTAAAPRVRVLLHSLAFGTLRPLVTESTDAPSGLLSARQLTMTMEVMAHSLIWWTRELVARRQLGSGGRVLALTSAGSERVLPSYGAVAAAKAALEAHVRQLAIELIPLGITVNALRAGVTDTPASRLLPEAEQLLTEARRRHPAGRITQVEDVAELVAAWLSPGLDWVTGNIIGVDGGETILA